MTVALKSVVQATIDSNGRERLVRVPIDAMKIEVEPPRKCELMGSLVNVGELFE